MQNDNLNNTQDTQSNPVAPTPTISDQSAGPTVMPEVKAAWHRRKLTIVAVAIVALLLLASAGVATWALKHQTKPPTKTSHQTTKNNSSGSGATPVVMSDIVQAVKYRALSGDQSPANVVYAVQTQGKATAACTPTDTKLYIKPLSGGSATLAKDLGSNDVSFSAVYKNEVAVVATPNCGSTSGDEAIWFSADSGKTFSMVYTRHASDPKAESRDEITSIKFSSDGKTFLIGLFLWANAKPGNSQNVVKEIDPFAGSVKDLFTVSSAGVFLEGYNRSAGQAYYYPGCFNCDGNGFNQLRLHDLTKRTDVALYNDPKHIGSDVVFNLNFSRALTVKGAASTQALGWDKPFTVEELDIAGKSAKTLVTVNESTNVSAGYTDDWNMYYAKDKTVYTLNEDGSSSPIFAAPQSILNVLYVSASQVVVATGSYSTYDVASYAGTPKTATKVLQGDDHTTTIGVTWN